MKSINGSDVDQAILLDSIINSIKGLYWVVFLFGILGASSAYIYHYLSPKQYEVLLQVNILLDASGSRIIEPSSLIAQYSAPILLDDQSRVICFQEAGAVTSNGVSSSIKLSTPKGGNSEVDILVRMNSKVLAKECANSIADMIAKSQALILDSKKQQASLRLVLVNKRILEFKALLKNSKSYNGQEFYILNKIHSLEDEQGNLISAVNYRPSESKGIYIADRQLGQKLLTITLAGFFAGIFLGLFICIIRATIVMLLSRQKKI